MTEICAAMDAAALHALGPLELAHVGDGVFELLVRTHLALQGSAKVGDLHRAAVAYVSAPAQAAAIARLQPYLTEEEQKVYHRGRNAHVHSTPSGCTIAQYHAATGLEALFGYLWLSGRAARVQELFNVVLENHHAS